MTVSADLHDAPPAATQELSPAPVTVPAVSVPPEPVPAEVYYGDWFGFWIWLACFLLIVATRLVEWVWTLVF